MSYDQALKLIGLHLYKKFRVQIQYGLFSLSTFEEEKKALQQMLSGLDIDILQHYLNAMYDAGMIVKDDGLTVTFSPDYIKTLQEPRYFS